MMAMAQQYAHPGGMPGQGLPHGHPMDPRDPRNSHGMPPSQPGLGQMQMSMPGGPQVVQNGMMGGMPQMGQQQHMSNQMAAQLAIQNAQMNGAMVSMQNMNPQMMQQMRMRNQAQQAMANQGQQGMMMNPGQHVMMPNGMPGPGVQRVSLPAHLQSQIPGNGQPHPGAHMTPQQQMFAAQQQHQQQQIQAAQQAAQQHHMQQQMAMQQQGSQAGPSPAPSAAAQPLRPPSQVQNRPDQPGPPPTSQPQPPQPQQTPVQQQQQQPPQPQQPNPQQQQQQQQHALQQQQQQQQQQNQQVNQGQQSGPQSQQQTQPGQPQINIPHNNTENLTQAQRVQIMRTMASRSNMQTGAAVGAQGACVLTLLQFADDLSSARENGQGVDLSYWQSFVSKFFAHEGSLRHGLLNAKDSSTKAYELSGSPLPWYYHTFFKNGVDRIELNIERATEKDLPTPNNGHVVESARTTFTYYYGNTHQIVSVGRLQVIFDGQGKIKLFDFKGEENHEFINRNELVPGIGSPDQKAGTGSPKLNKKQQQQRKSTLLNHPTLLPALELRPVGDFGVPNQVQTLFEVAENLIGMRHLFNHHAANPSLSATETLKAVVHNFEQEASNRQHSADGQPGSLGPQGFPGGPPNQRTPGAGPQFASPAPNAHLTLPGGSMTASPAMMNHGLPGQGGVPMVPNASQGGSGNPSANASPSVAGHGKKRRQSQVKTEDDGDKSKPSPRMPNGPSKRIKGQ